MGHPSVSILHLVTIAFLAEDLHGSVNPSPKESRRVGVLRTRNCQQMESGGGDHWSRLADIVLGPGSYALLSSGGVFVASPRLLLEQENERRPRPTLPLCLSASPPPHRPTLVSRGSSPVPEDGVRASDKRSLGAGLPPLGTLTHRRCDYST
jgi:hypothetical protein